MNNETIQTTEEARYHQEQEREKHNAVPFAGSKYNSQGLRRISVRL